MIEIKRMHYKDKIIIDYPTTWQYCNFATLHPKSDGLVVSIFLKDGTRIDTEDISMITLKVMKDDKKK